MFRRFSVNFAALSIFMDLITVVVALSTAAFFRPVLNNLSFAANVMEPMQLPTLLYPLFAFTWVVILLLLSVYDGRRNLYAADEFTSLTLGSIIAAVSMAGMLYLSYREISRLFFIFFVLLAYLGMLSWRGIARLAFRSSGNGLMQIRHVLIVGAGPVGRAVEQQIREHPYMGLEVVGFLDDDILKQKQHADILGPINDLIKSVNELHVHDVVIALPNRAFQQIDHMIVELHNLPVKVWVIPDYFGMALHKAVVEEFAGLPLLDLRAPALNEYQRLVKRIFDLVITLLILPFAAPVMAVIALAIWLEDRGPIFFFQDRVGENGKIFHMMKFRTMVPEAESLRYLVEKRDAQGNLIHKSKNDPRITRVGHFLRRTSLDEIPQLFNILTGEMSLVGPRPELPYLVDRYEPWQRKRFAVPQGITGWWQVNGRSDRPMHLHTEDDLYYVQHYSLLLDLYILLKTVAVVIKGKGAY